MKNGTLVSMGGFFSLLLGLLELCRLYCFITKKRFHDWGLLGGSLEG